MPTVPDLVGEPCDQWGNPESKTHEFMRTYVREVVTRYQDSPAIWGWEFGNEYNLDADLPNAKEHLPPIVPQLGRPQPAATATSSRTRWSARPSASSRRKSAVRPHAHRLHGQLDSSPSAWHQMREGTWTKDSPEQICGKCWRKIIPTLWTRSRSHLYEPEAERLGRSDADGAAARRSLSSSASSVFRVTVPQQATIRPVGPHRAHGGPLAALWAFDDQGNRSGPYGRRAAADQLGGPIRPQRANVSAREPTHQRQTIGSAGADPGRDPKARRCAAIPARISRSVSSSTGRQQRERRAPAAIASALGPGAVQDRGLGGGQLRAIPVRKADDSTEASRREKSRPSCKRPAWPDVDPVLRGRPRRA